MIPTEQLAEWKRLAEAATPGEWSTYSPARTNYHYIQGTIHNWIAEAMTERDAAFIAAARVAVPALCAAVSEQAAKIAELEARLAECEGKRGDYKRARGVLPWKEGDEPPVDAIRRLRGD